MTGETIRRPRRTAGQRLVIALNVVAMLLFLGGAGSLAYGYKKYGQVPRIEIGAHLARVDPSEAASGAENFLVVGVDSSDRLDPEDPLARSRTSVGGIRSDTMMVLRVDPASQRAALLSLPRDLYLPISGTRGSGKLNSAVQIGGPQLLLETIQDSLGIDIHHYVQVDFFGFYRLVEALDGIPIHFAHPVRDRRSGLDVPEAGCTTLDPVNALGFVRSRAYQEYVDGRWRTDPSGDIGRIRRQQRFILAALDRAFSRGLRNPVTLDELIDSGLDAVTLDDTLDGADIVDLALRFRKFELENLDLYELPAEGGSAGGASVLRLLSTRAQPVLDVFRDVDPSQPDESAVRIRVLNGTGRPGEAAAVSGELRAVGFSIAGTGDSDRLGVDRTELHYPPSSAAAADLVDRWSVRSLRLVEDDDVAVVTLITGSDWSGLRAEPRPAGSTTTSTLGTTTTTEGSASTTSVVGTIPATPPDGVDCG